MKQSSMTLFGVTVCVCATLLGVGCADKVPPGKKNIQGVKVNGRVVINGTPLKLLPQEEVTVSFSALDGKGVEAPGDSAVVKEDGSFTLNGPIDKGIPAMKYSVVVISQIYGKDDSDRFEKLFEEKQPPLVAEVANQEGQTFIIDLGKRQLTKQ